MSKTKALLRAFAYTAGILVAALICSAVVNRLPDWALAVTLVTLLLVVGAVQYRQARKDQP